ncbi:MAG: isocitrate dehydrogenase [Epulopiscium sp. Nuni2H_MBin001]|nr:MAG: isocitrate dehydrogenase [Epulopiscium sp. Nuni2H_MBin001]
MTPQQHFLNLVETQLNRVETIKENHEAIDYKNKAQIIIGLCAGDGIGPVIMDAAVSVLRVLLKDEIADGKIILKQIEGLTIENRLEQNTAIPPDVLEEIKSCDVLLKGPTTTPSKGQQNIESANVALRRELDLYANVRPVVLKEENIDWIFFRENTEGAYVLGSQGIDIDEDLAFDFRVITTPGVERIARAAFEYAHNNNKKRVSIVTKANILKKTDGKFLDVCYRIAKEYPHIQTDDWFIDIMTAKLIDTTDRHEFEVFILPNLYGDIITDEAAQIQGGVGTAGSANIGSRYAMFEAIHGSAPRLVETGCAGYANPSSLIKAAEIMLRHIGYVDKADKLIAVLDKAQTEVKVTGSKNDASCVDITKYIIENIR